MKYCILIILMFLINHKIEGQNSEQDNKFIVSYCDTSSNDICKFYKKSVQIAEEDWQNNRPRIFQFGRMGLIFRSRFLSEKYGISQIMSGCSVFLEELAYNETIQRKLTEIFGRDIFKNIDEEVEIFNDSLKSIKNCDAVYIEGEKKMWERIYSCLNYKLIEDTLINREIVVQINIDKKGRITKSKVLNGLSSKVDEACLYPIKNCLFRFYPAKKWGLKINSKKILRIKLDPKNEIYKPLRD